MKGGGLIGLEYEAAVVEIVKIAVDRVECGGVKQIGRRLRGRLGREIIEARAAFALYAGGGEAVRPAALFGVEAFDFGGGFEGAALGKIIGVFYPAAKQGGGAKPYGGFGQVERALRLPSENGSEQAGGDGGQHDDGDEGKGEQARLHPYPQGGGSGAPQNAGSELPK
ncbi:hypothetical protein [Kingella potus]|uniref:hypothetical protein n=1 Tax=Kingella potus TaxID=265175 RepID=UPI001FD20854|nr:hypothetical protein [Kingella potus]UOP00155.1 hypothetical protein LVJ84_09400 [Kingella potus]